MRKRNVNQNLRDSYFYSEIVGVALKSVKVIEGTQGYDSSAEHPLTDDKYDKIIPKKLPRGFPETIRRYVIKSIKELINDINNNTQGWNNLSRRLNALRAELYLFTRGKEGIKGITLKSDKEKSKTKVTKYFI